MKTFYSFYYTLNLRKSKGVFLSFLIFCLFACAILLPFTLQKGGNALLPRREYYLLRFYEGKDATDAKQAADALSLRGGAGTICEERGVFSVYACAYEKGKDALEVQKRIKDAGGSATVIPLVLPALSARKGEKENQALLLAEECFSVCFSGFTKGYKDAEKGKERALICAELSAVRERVTALKKAVGDMETSATGNNVFRAVTAMFADCESSCEALMLESTRSALSIQCKRAQLSLLFGYRTFLSSLPRK